MLSRQRVSQSAALGVEHTTWQIRQAYNCSTSLLSLYLMDYSSNYRRGCQELHIYIHIETHTLLQGPLFSSLPMLFPQLLCSLHTLVVSSLQTTSPKAEGTTSGVSMETPGKKTQFLQRFTRTIWSTQCYGIAKYSPLNPPESPLHRALKQFSKEHHVMRGAGGADGRGTIDWTGCGGDVPATWKTTKCVGQHTENNCYAKQWGKAKIPFLVY